MRTLMVLLTLFPLTVTAQVPLKRAEIEAKDQARREALRAKKAEAETTRQANAKDWAVVHEVERLIKQAAPLPDETVAAVKQLAEAHQDDARGASYDSLATRAAFYAAWQRKEGRAAALGEALGVEGLKSGTYNPNGEKLAVSTQAKADHCYALVGRWQRPTADFSEPLQTDHHFSMKPAQSMPAFSVHMTPSRGKQELFVGACAEHEGTFTVELTVQHVKLNPLDWALLSWPRDAFPPSLSVGLRVVFDPCDGELWARMWTHPIAGTVAYAGSEPVLITDPTDLKSGSIHIEHLSGQELIAYVSQLSALPRGPISVRAAYGAPRCRSGPVLNPRASAYQKCNVDVWQRYSQRIAVQGSRVAFAKSALMHDLADREETRLYTAYHRDQELECHKFYAPIAAAHERIFEKTRAALESAQPKEASKAGIVRLQAEHAFK